MFQRTPERDMALRETNNYFHAEYEPSPAVAEILTVLSYLIGTLTGIILFGSLLIWVAG